MQFSQSDTQPKIAKELPSFKQTKLNQKISFPPKNKKHSAHNRHSMTRQINNDNGLQTQWTNGLLITAVWRNGGRSGNINSSASNKHLCSVDSEVLRKPPLRQAANRYGQG